MFRFRKNFGEMLYKGFVSSCAIVTFGGLAYVGFGVGNYLLKVRPQIESKKEQETENLLEEGRPKEMIRDSAQTIKA